MTAALTLFQPRQSPVHAWHPLTKLTWVGFLIIVGLAIPGAWATLGLIALVVTPLALLARVLRPLAAAAAKVVLPFALSLVLIQGFLWSGGTPLFALGPLSLKAEGLRFALSASLRILLLVTSFLWFAFTTRPDVLMTALVQRGMPTNLAYLVVTTIQIVPRFQARAAAILDAQRARGLRIRGSLLQRFQALLPLVVPLVLSSLIDVEERALAIEARAFNRQGPKTSLVTVGEARWEPALRRVLLAAALLCVMLALYLRLKARLP